MDHTACIFSSCARKLASLATQEILKTTEHPGVILFAGGLLAPVTFPVEVIQAACARIFTDNLQASLQYAPMEGLSVLREWIAQHHGITASCALITTGPQQGLDLLDKIFADPQSKVLVETPAYLGALQAFSLFEPTYTSIAIDDQGLLPDTFTPELAAGARLFYTIPNFQNPTSRRLPLDRCQAPMTRARELGVLFVENDPYGELSYAGDVLPSLRSLDPGGVVCIGSFSKILASGMHLNYIIAPGHTRFKLMQAKQTSNLHTPSFTQRVVCEILKTGLFDMHIPSIRNLYGKQCEAMLDSLMCHMPAGVHWNCPEDGMFIQVEAPEGINTMALLEKTIVRNVVFVPGTPFYANMPRYNALHLASVTVTPERIEQGIAVLGKLMRVEITVLTPKAA